MNQEISIVIPTHNRQSHLKRILDYYANSAINVYIVDSTINALDASFLFKNDTYYHLPGYTLTAKLFFVLNKIPTDYVVVCADDDFTIPEGMFNCVKFLNDHPDYSSAIGNCIWYKLNKPTGKIAFDLIYNAPFTLDHNEPEPLSRLKLFFENYRTIYCGVHRTQYLLEAFKNAEPFISNLFLNEYLLCIGPICRGKIAELPFLYQIREYSEISADKHTVNLDTMFEEEKYRHELEAFIHFESHLVANITGVKEEIVYQNLFQILSEYASKIRKDKQITKTGVVKVVSGIISKIPIIGLHFLNKYRMLQKSKTLALLIRNKDEKGYVDEITESIKKFSSSIE